MSGVGTATSTMTLDEIAAVLDAYWHDTGKWDPLVNGTIAAEMDKCGDPNAPGLTPDERHAIVEARHKVGEQYWFNHDLAVGQRTAVESLRHRFGLR